MFLELGRPLTSSHNGFFVRPKSVVVVDDVVGAFTSADVASTASAIGKLRQQLDIPVIDLDADQDENPDLSGSPDSVEIEISRDDAEAVPALVTSPPDLVLSWTGDLEVSFRFLGDRRVNPDISYPMHPIPETLKKIPSSQSLYLRYLLTLLSTRWLKNALFFLS